MFQSGEIINNRYILNGKIAEGGMSKVYMAYDAARKRNVALKCSDCAMPLAREFHIMKSSDYAAIPKAYDLFEYGGMFIMALEYIEGITLEGLVEGRHEPFGKYTYAQYGYAQLIRTVITICMTADYLHVSKRILYLDYKPSNIIVGNAGVFLVDYGAATDMKDACPEDGIAMYGTKMYAAPEQKTARGVPDARTDIYQIGALLKYVMEKRGIKGKGGVRGESGIREKSGMRGKNGVRSRALRGIARRCMAEKISARYPSAREVAALLADCINYDGRIY